MMIALGIICLIIRAIYESWSDAHYVRKNKTPMLYWGNIMFKMLFALLFNTGYKHHSNYKVDKKIDEMRKQGRGIRIIDKDGKIKFIPMG